MPKISKYPEAEVPLTGDEFTVVVQDGRTKRVTLTNFGTGFGGFTPPTGSGPVTVTSGVLDTSAAGTTGTGDYVREDSPTLIAPTWTGTANGGSLDLTGRIRIPSTLGIAGDYGLWFGGFTGVSELDIGAPILGNGNNSYPSPWGNSGYIDFDMFASSDRILSASDVVYAFTRFFNHSTPGTISFPANTPGGDQFAYWRDIFNDGDATLTFDVDGGSGATVDVGPGQFARLWINGDSVYGPFGGASGSSLLASDEVDVMDYWEAGDDEPTIDGRKTIGIAAAMQRAWEAEILTKKRRVIRILPITIYSADYGDAVAYSWNDALSWDCSLVWTFGIRGSGVAAPIIPDRSGGLNDKLTLSNGGAKGMPTLFVYEHMLWVGNETTGVPATDADCISLLKTSAEMQVSYRYNMIYGCQGDGTAPGLVDLSCSGAVLEENFFVNCGMNNNESILYFQAGTFGFHMQSTHFYTSKHYVGGDPGDLVNPFDSEGWTKTDATPWWMSTRGDSDVGHAPFITIKNCTFGSSSGVYGCLLVDPDGWYVRNVKFIDCWITGNINKVIEARENVDAIEFEGCQIQLNGAFDIVDLQDPSVKHLTMRKTRIMTIGGDTNPDSTIAANSGQESVIVQQCMGGTWDLTACDHYDIDESSMQLVDAITLPGGSSTAGFHGHKGLKRITVAESAVYTLDGVEQSVASIQIEGTGAGSRTVRYEPTTDVRCYARYIRNNTPGDLIVKDTAGSGEEVTIPTLEARQVWFSEDGATSGTSADPPAALAIEDLSWDYLLYDYAGAPWAGIASAGASGGRDAVTDGADPSVGTALNGHGVASFNGTTQKLKSEAGVDLAALATAAAWSLVCVFKPASTQTSPIPSQPASDQCLFVNIDGIHGISSTDQGARAWQYDGDYSPATAPTSATATAWAYLLAYRDGTGKVYTRLIKSGADGGWSAGTTTDADWGGEADTFRYMIGSDYTGTTSFYSGDIAFLGAAKVAFTSGEFDDIITGLNDMFGLSF